MSGIYENLPFRRGATYGTIGGGTQFLGKEYMHEDFTYGTGMYVKVRVCINNSGIARAGFGLIAILAILGWDRFWLGDIGLGVLKYITAGGCLIWWLVDIFTASSRLASSRS